MDEHRVNVHYLPRDVVGRQLEGSAVAVIDVLRATSTICRALASGASTVVPFVEINDTLAAALRVGRETVVLGGERKGLKIDGFDLGNSPAEYTPEAIQGRPVFITTTNGTRALRLARLAKRVVAAAFLNLSAVVASLKNEPQIDILCAGTEGCETGEDILAAGALVDLIEKGGQAPYELNDAAMGARDKWQSVIGAARITGRSLSVQLALEFRDTAGGRNLIGIGLDQDLVDCAQVDRLTVVPELDVRNWRITSQ
jgi:2-phosphosulfolactate phosphatase